MNRAFPLLLLLAACQPPFDVSRKDLGPFRIAALGVVDGQAEAAIWSGLGLYHETAPQLAWTLDGEVLGEGWGVEVPDGDTLGLTVTAPDGATYEAQVSVGVAPDALDVSRSEVGPFEDVSLAARRAASGTPVAHGAAEVLRLTLGGVQDGHTARWMSADGQGTLLELTEVAADVLAEELVFDEGAVVERTPTDPGVYSQLALTLDGAGGNRWVWVDGAIGDDGPFMLHEERLVRVDAALDPGLYGATLVRADDLAGVALTDLSPAADLSEMEPDCGAPDVAFRLDWITEGRCPLAEVEGARVVLELR
ncbi:MAG: hypothetical protein H6739_01670 [Alphaproteobacteria bacterium]|nr:hypothetical protein [Alphaproteobacteria bacterium]